MVTDAAALRTAEGLGAGFGAWFDAAAQAQGISTTAQLARSPHWQALRGPLAEHLRRIAATDPQAGVGVARYSHRLFDARWLDSGQAFFELVGVANRLDRRPFHDGSCGEIRLIYRLAYRSDTMQSRLPMTVSVELRADPPDATDPQHSCASVARRWMAPSPAPKGEALGRWLVSPSGPLAPDQMRRARIAQVAVNLQSVRWPSGVRPDLGGHAEYLMRAWRWNASAGRYEPGPLENTPDVERLRAQPALRAELHDWLRQPAQMRALDGGTLRVPERFLATTVQSVTPRGLARLANRPFAQVYKDGDWQPVPGSRVLNSPAAVLRRLDDMSCAGCHQSRAVAGFHLLGEDSPGTRTFTPGNAVALAHSPHVQDELPRRAAYVQALLRTEQPDPFRPLAEGGGPRGEEGAACGLGDPGFAGWQCASGLQCQPQVIKGRTDAVGVCLPAQPTLGGLCEPSRLTTQRDPTRDHAQALPRLRCGDDAPVCERTTVGFPGGMCSGGCAPGEQRGADGVCGRIAILNDFNACVAARRPFAECLQHTRPGLLRRCSAAQACRDDYICAQADGQPTGQGACIPPYFLFQMRVDGHP